MPKRLENTEIGVDLIKENSYNKVKLFIKKESRINEKI
jgi:hypothetical protein